MDRDGRLNVVDGPVLWRASPAGLLGRRKTGLLALRSPLRGSAGDGFFKIMPVYYDDSAYGDHIFIFAKMTSLLPAVLFLRIRAWSRVRDSST